MKGTLTKSRLNQFIKESSKLRLLVVGDMMLDRFIYGAVTRISPEAPIPVVRVTKEACFPGGAANVARNLSDFGIQVDVCGMAGNDSDGKTLRNLFAEASIGTDGLILFPNYQTITKTRIIARQQQLVRVDREEIRHTGPKELTKIDAFLKKEIARVDAIIIEDYGKGFVTQDVVDLIVKYATKHKKIVTVDPNTTNPLDWTGATALKPNRGEASSLINLNGVDRKLSVDQMGEELIKRWNLPYLLMTLSEEGMVLFSPKDEPFRTPTLAREVYDVSGAGDTVIALFTSALAAGFKGWEAAEIANHAAGVVVGKLGTATLKPEELVASLERNGN